MRAIIICLFIAAGLLNCSKNPLLVGGGCAETTASVDWPVIPTRLSRPLRPLNISYHIQLPSFSTDSNKQSDFFIENFFLRAGLWATTVIECQCNSDLPRAEHFPFHLCTCYLTSITLIFPQVILPPLIMPPCLNYRYVGFCAKYLLEKVYGTLRRLERKDQRGLLHEPLFSFQINRT